MISRCPSCAAEVAEDAKRCPSCFWDFEAFKRVPPGSTPAPKPVERPKPAERQEPPIQLKPPSVPAEAPKPPPPPPAAPVKPAAVSARAAPPDIPLTQIRQLPPRPAAPAPNRPEAAGPEKAPPPDATKIRHPRENRAAASSLIWAAALGLAAAYIGAVRLMTEPEASSPPPPREVRPLFQKRETVAPRQAPAPTPAPEPLAPAPPPAPKAAPAWLFEGLVYDLISLTPVYGVQISLRDAAGEERGQATTDSRGRYRVSIEPPAQGGYKISIAHPDYRDGYLEEITPPYRTLEPEQRRALAAAKVYNLPWKGQTSRPTRKDLVLIPNE